MIKLLSNVHSRVKCSMKFVPTLFSFSHKYSKNCLTFSFAVCISVIKTGGFNNIISQAR